MWEELGQLHKTLDEIENAFLKVAARSAELDAYGFKRLAKWLDLTKLLPALDRFPIELSASQSIIGVIDRPRFDSLNKLLDETMLEDLISRFSVKLRIAEQERHELNPLYVLVSTLKVLFLKRNSSELFANSDVSMEAVLSAIARIKALIRIVGEDARSRFENDDEIFKPSNIDTQKISIEIDAAITVLKSEQGLRPQERDKLIEYLQEAKDELSKKDASWRKIVGTLVIVSTLLGGIAVAPQATENVGNAINYILGTSIETAGLDRLKLPEYEDEGHPRLPSTRSI